MKTLILIKDVKQGSQDILIFFDEVNKKYIEKIFKENTTMLLEKRVYQKI